MTKYLETKRNSIEETITSVVLGEAKFQVNYSKGGKLFSKTINAKDEDDAEDKAIKKFKIDDDDIRSVVKEELELDEAKYEVQYTVRSRVGDSRSRMKSRLSKIDIDAKSKEDAEKKFFKQAEKSPMMKDAMRRDMLDVVYVGLKESLNEAMSKDMAKKILSMQKGQSFSKIASGDMVPMVYLSGDERDQLKKEFGRLSRDVPNRDKGISIPNLINLAKTGNPRGDYDTEGNGKHLIFKMKRKGTPKTVGDAAKLAGIQLESVEFDEGKRISPKILNLMKVITAYKQAKPGSKERQNMLNFINKELKAMGKQPIKDDGVQTLRLGEGYESEVLKVLNKADIDGYFKMGKLYVSRRDAKDAKKALEDSDEITKLPKMVMEDERMKRLTPRQRQALARVQAKPKSQVSLPKMPDFMKPKKEENEMDMNEKILDEKFSITLPPVRGGKKLLNIDMGRAIRMLKDFGATKNDIRNVLSGKGGRFQNAGGEMFFVQREETEMDIIDTIRNVVEKKLDPVNKDALKKKFDDRKDKDIDNDGDVDSTDKYLHTRRKAVSKAIAKDKKEAYDIGKDYAQHTLDVTPGQGKKDVDKMLNTAYTKNQSMRETLAKVWGLDEGKSPFQKEEEKPLTKTMTGQKPTKVEVEPKMEKK